MGFLQKRWQIGLTLSAASDADIILCSGKEFWLHPCYWFVINGWGGTTTGIRRCSEEKIPTERYPIYSCKYLRHAYNVSTLIILPVNVTFRAIENYHIFFKEYQYILSTFLNSAICYSVQTPRNT